jgi:hypothetical protein
LRLTLSKSLRLSPAPLFLIKWKKAAPTGKKTDRVKIKLKINLRRT